MPLLRYGMPLQSGLLAAINNAGQLNACILDSIVKLVLKLNNNYKT
jgi:hypothetical protein